MKPVKTPFGIDHLKGQVPKEVLMLRMMTDLIKMHSSFMATVEDFRNNIQKQKGPKGDKPSQQEIMDVMRPLVEMAFGERIKYIVKDLIPEVKDGATPSKEELLALMMPLIPKLPKQTKISMPTAAQIYEMIRPFIQQKDVRVEIEEYKDRLFDFVLAKMKDEKSLTTKDINGLDAVMSSMWNQIGKKGGEGKMRGGGDTVRAGTNVIITRNADGTTTISAMGGGSGLNVTTEVLAGVQSGNNITLAFSGLVHTPPTSIIQITRNGQVLTPGSTAVGGYTLTGLTSATVYSADAGDTFLVTYSYV